MVTFLYLDDIENPPASGPDGLQAVAGAVRLDRPARAAQERRPYLTIHVNGQQYLWRYDYPGDQQLFSYHEMVVPMDTTVVLEITASDVIHSWWIPKLGGKADAVPGHVNETWFKIPPTGGHLPRASAPSCAASGHADMRAAVEAVTPERVPGLGRAASASDIEEAGEAARRAAQARAKGRRATDGSRDRSTAASIAAPGGRAARAPPAAARLAVAG